MIDVRELRENNYVQILGEVFPLTRKRLIRVLEGKIEVEPIILSESLLIDSGFRKYPNPNTTPTTVFELNGFKLIRSGRQYTFYAFDAIKVHVKHLHHLQNIILDLSGKELPIKK